MVPLDGINQILDYGCFVLINRSEFSAFFETEDEVFVSFHKVFIIDMLLETLDGIGPFFFVFRFFHDSRLDQVVEVVGRRYGFLVFEDDVRAGVTLPGTQEEAVVLVILVATSYEKAGKGGQKE